MNRIMHGSSLRNLLIAVIIVVVCMPCVVYANMAAPKDADIGTSITLEKNEEIAVLSEVLDITVEDDKAFIVATYRMKNATEETVATSSMFLSPNIEENDVQVKIDEAEIAFVAESYALNYDTEVATDGWQYAVFTGADTAYADNTVDSITFDMEFAAMEEREIVISYIYQLGGYPNYDYNAKEGIITYYLTPAIMWKDFENLTINIYLDEDMPIIKESNLDFEKVDARTYQYVSHSLPEDDLSIVIDENWWQNIFSTLRNPYLPMVALMTSPIMIFVIVIGVGIWIYLRRVGKE